MANIQLDQEILDVEQIIDEGNHDEAFRQLILLRDRFGRRPEYRYLKALFDMTFKTRSDMELLSDVRALVGEQPDFLEAVSVLAVLLDRTGDRDRAMVFAREAIHAKNDRARARANAVLGDTPKNPTADEEPFATRSSSQMRAVKEPAREAPTKPNVRPVVMPTPGRGQNTPRATQALFTAESEAFPPPPPPPDGDPLRLPSEPPLQEFDEGRQGDTLEGLPRAPSVPPGLMFQGFDVLNSSGNSTMESLSEPPGGPALDSSPDSGKEARALDFIPFSPANVAMPPPPTVPPEPLGADFSAQSSASSQDDRTAPTLRGIRSPLPATEPQFERVELSEATPPPQNRLRSPAVRVPTPLPPRHAVDHTGVDRSGVERSGVDRRRSASAPSRPAIAIAQPLQQIRGWFQYARQNQIPSGEGFSTARTLIDLCERVVEGATPLSAEPVPLDRRGLILVEQRLEALRGSRTGTQPTAERGAVTAAAAFLLGLLLKECDGRASDTSAEDGACKVVVPSGATVRPLLVAAAFSRSRGPGLVETFDRAATAHMRRGPTRRTTSNNRQPTQPPPAPSHFDLTVLRRDLDASTLGVTDPQTPPGPRPSTDLRRVASDFWASDLGREIAGTSRRVGTFTIADVDAIERYASKTYSAVGFAPPGTPWPWAPSEAFDDMILSWGAILGEVLVGLYSGRWEADPGNPEDRHLYRVVVSGGVVAWPVAKAYMRLARGIPHDLSVYVDAVGRVVGRQALNP